MLKYLDTAIVFREIPNEITLAINISNCPCHCKGCHSPHLWENEGIPLRELNLFSLIAYNKGITAVCFMGGDADPNKLGELVHYVRNRFPELKIGWYSGMTFVPHWVHYLDYIKLGRYDQELGPLTSPTTNQIMYKVEHDGPVAHLIDITATFYNK